MQNHRRKRNGAAHLIRATILWIERAWHASLSFFQKSPFRSDLSDGEFILAAAEVLFPLGITPRDVEVGKHFIGEYPQKRAKYIKALVQKYLDGIERAKRMERNNPDSCEILGVGRVVTTSMWMEREQLLQAGRAKSRSQLTANRPREFQHSGSYVVSAIASLYKGGKYIEQFLHNITSQTIFHDSELIIIDADSDEDEFSVIKEFQKKYSNIVYRRINHRIGIYDAWNVGIGMARGKYLTNTNLDDLRRIDSFELQRRALDNHPFADVVYQDYFVSFDACLSFDDVAAFGFKSDLPIVTPHNLLVTNSPHNAPMWRKSLHDELGSFDTSFRIAGDWEFWLRCMSKGKSFLKLNDPHVVYFQNPHGISTHSETAGGEERAVVLRKYGQQLIQPHLLMSRQRLAQALGIAPIWDWRTPHYDVVQEQLELIGQNYKTIAVAERSCGAE